MMSSIELNSLRLLHRSMNARRIDRCRFPFHRNHKEFDVFFFAGMEPYELMFGLVGGRWSMLVKVLEGYRVDTRLGKEDYAKLCEALGLKYDPNNRFRPKDFFEDLNRAIPREVSRSSEVKPQDVARYFRNVKEADKIYFAGWRSHQDPEVRDVTERNLEKTRRLLGEDAYRRCLKYRISSAWTADRRKASDNRKRPVPLPPSAGCKGGEEERIFRHAVTTGLSDLKEGREVSLDDAKMRLGLS